jgi:hypothetical protein
MFLSDGLELELTLRTGKTGIFIISLIKMMHQVSTF